MHIPWRLYWADHRRSRFRCSLRSGVSVTPLNLNSCWALVSQCMRSLFFPFMFVLIMFSFKSTIIGAGKFLLCYCGRYFVDEAIQSWELQQCGCKFPKRAVRLGPSNVSLGMELWCLVCFASNLSTSVHICLAGITGPRPHLLTRMWRYLLVPPRLLPQRVQGM